jgi:cyclopropane fatty-acyl-phospholipid synthase-like methyltransferase
MSVIKRLFYELFYLRKPPWDSGVSPPELMEFIEQNPPGRALDLGCGTGTNAITLAQHGWRVTGVDFVGKAIRSARRKARSAGLDIDFHQEDATRLRGISGPFDLILDIGCFHSLTAEGRTAYVKNLERLLAPNGAYLMYAFYQQDGSGTGLNEQDLELLSNRLRLVTRQDGWERGRRASAWFVYELGVAS